MGKRRHGKPDRFGEGGGFSRDEEPVDDATLEAAVRRFVGYFVKRSKRERAIETLSRPRTNDRIDALQQLPTWIDRALQTELDGDAGFPQHLQASFGSIRGVLLDARGARGMTMAGAVWSTKMECGSGALFIANTGAFALLVPEIGSPTLCLRPS